MVVGVHLYCAGFEAPSRQHKFFGFDAPWVSGTGDNHCGEAFPVLALFNIESNDGGPVDDSRPRACLHPRLAWRGSHRLRVSDAGLDHAEQVLVQSHPGNGWRLHRYLEHIVS